MNINTEFNEKFETFSSQKNEIYQFQLIDD